MKNKEYGGYIEFESFSGKEYHEGAIKLNCGRNCLAYLIKARNIKKIYLPYFLCSSVENVCRKLDIHFEYYHINHEFMPQLDKKLMRDEWLYIVNFFGQVDDKQICLLKKQYGDNIICDYSQAFFQKPIENIDTFYTCRKFFGVPDGAYLYTNAKKINCSQDISFERMHFLLGRYEKTASEFYPEYVENNKMFANEEIKTMSKLTTNLLRAIDYNTVCTKRENNFNYFDEQFKQINQLNLIKPIGPFMYPLYLNNGDYIRKQLQRRKIYIPTLWPDVLERCGKEDIEYRMAKNILPLPIDQRYNLDDIKYIVKEIDKCINSEN